MNKFGEILFYIRHISFILFLIAGIVLYPAFFKYQMGKVCLLMFLIYTIFTFVLIFIKNKSETYNILNNLVTCLLHFYFCFVAYKYYVISDVLFVNNVEYFSFNFLIFSICMFILIGNKLLLKSCK